MGEMIDAPVRRTVVISLALLGGACSSAPKVTDATKRVAANPRAIVTGVVRDEEGLPVAGVGVRGIPRGKDVPWAPPVTTGRDGRPGRPIAHRHQPSARRRAQRPRPDSRARSLGGGGGRAAGPARVSLSDARSPRIIFAPWQPIRHPRASACAA